MRWMVTSKGVEENCTDSALREAIGVKGRPLWVDIQAPGEDDFKLLESVLGLHSLTVEDMRHEGQRPKWEDYPGYIFLVLITPEWAGGHLIAHEQHLCISSSWVVTVRSQSSPWLDGLRKRLASDPSLSQDRVTFLTYLVADAIVDATFPALDAIDGEVDALEDRLVTEASQQDLAEITTLRHSVTDLRRTLGAQRDCFQRLVTQSLDPKDTDSALYFRDIYDHLVRQYETVDSLRDLLSGAMDTYLSSVSNRLNSTMKTLTVMASLFLPLTFLTGFFGMNFAFETDRVQPTGLDFAGGIGLMVLSLVIQLYLFKGRRWI